MIPSIFLKINLISKRSQILEHDNLRLRMKTTLLCGVF